MTPWPPQSWRLAKLGAAALALALAVWTLVNGAPGRLIQAAKAQVSSPCNGYGVQPVSLTPVLPAQFSAATAQQGADCMAWQTFISLNWMADPSNPGQPNPNAPPASFGTPGDVQPKVWESYLEAADVFNPPGGARVSWKSRRPTLKLLSRQSEQGATDLSLSNIAQAGDGKWLTTQSGGLAYYEVRLNQDEVEFITTNVFSGSNLTTFAGQAACAQQPGQGGKGGFNLPGGGAFQPTAKVDTDCLGNPAIYGQNVGAIEVKAAWIVLPADHSLDYRYETAQAQITDPLGHTSVATVGLVGLHIVHKTPGGPQLVWATFEQIDNTPDEANGSYRPPTLPANPNQKPGPGYTFFNTGCVASQDPYYACVHNRLPGVPCSAGGQPAGCDPFSAPMQVTRVVPVDSTANGVTAYVWSLLPAQSVFNYYRLINVQWPSTPTPVGPGGVTPLPQGTITPSDATGIMANTTLETFQQTQNSCMDCHQAAPIAQASLQRLALLAGRKVRKVQPRGLLGASAPYASDYSFVFLGETVR